MMLLVGCVGGMRAQFSDYGVRLGLGAATISDDLATKSPILAANLGAYLNFGFTQSESILSEVFYLQSGVNLIRRGCNFEEEFEVRNNLAIRNGYRHAYYVQVPLLACVRMELPIRPRGHVAGFFLGPAVSYGLFGVFQDRLISPTIAQRSANYDNSINPQQEDDRNVFNHQRRLDVGVILGLSYEYRDWNISLYVDHGFRAVSTEEDIISIISQSIGNERTDDVVPNGNNVAYMLSLTYRLGSF